MQGSTSHNPQHILEVVSHSLAIQPDASLSPTVQHGSGETMEEVATTPSEPLQTTAEAHDSIAPSFQPDFMFQPLTISDVQPQDNQPNETNTSSGPPPRRREETAQEENVTPSAEPPQSSECSFASSFRPDSGFRPLRIPDVQPRGDQQNEANISSGPPAHRREEMAHGEDATPASEPQQSIEGSFASSFRPGSAFQPLRIPDVQPHGNQQRQETERPITDAIRSVRVQSNSVSIEVGSLSLPPSSLPGPIMEDAYTSYSSREN